jgi:hypothetical protein
MIGITDVVAYSSREWSPRPAGRGTCRLSRAYRTSLGAAAALQLSAACSEHPGGDSDRYPSMSNATCDATLIDAPGHRPYGTRISRAPFYRVERPWRNTLPL